MAREERRQRRKQNTSEHNTLVKVWPSLQATYALEASVAPPALLTRACLVMAFSRYSENKSPDAH